MTQHASGTQSATISTEHFLGTDPDTTSGIFQFWIETNNMARGDVLEISLYEEINDSADTNRKFFFDIIAHDQFTPMYVTPSFMLMHGWRFSIKQIAGTGRSFQWSIRKA